MKSHDQKHRPLLTAGMLLTLGWGLSPGGIAAPRAMPSPQTAKTPGEFTEALRKEARRDAASRGITQPLRDEGAPAREVPNRADLEKAFTQAQRENPMRKLPQAQGNDPAKQEAPVDLIASSDILCHKGKATLVPKRAILQIPASLSDRLKIEKGARIMNWADFFLSNRDWIKTVEVTRPQAEGVEPMPEATTEMLKKATTLVVATYQGGPISVLPLQVAAVNPEEPEDTNEPKP